MQGPNFIALAIPVFFAAIGFEMAFARAKGRCVYRAGDAVANMGCGIGQQLMSFFLSTGIITSSYQFVSHYKLWTIPTWWLPWLVALFGVELAYYWWHRLSHEVNLLWAAHVVHHQSEDYNLAVALRQSVTTWLTSLPFYLPLALLGVPLLHFGVILGLSTLYQFWIHTELVPSLGALEKVFNTPALHRVHHAINPGYLDKNHAATFSFYDRLFGTWQPETQPCIYGTTRPFNSYNPLWAQVETYAELLRQARRAPSVREAVKLLWASPAWCPSWAGPTPTRDFAQKYNPRGSPFVARYVLVNWALLIAAVFSFLMWGAALSFSSQGAILAMLVLSMVTLPGLVEAKPWAKPLELVRLLALPLAAAILLT